MVEQYRIVLVNLDPTQGTEIKKTRPCVIISPSEMNNNIQRVIIAPMTSNTKNYPFRVRSSHNGREGMICLDQIRTIDQSRIVKKFDMISNNEISEIKKILKSMLVD
ncbi:type II toxin-antitoxin system PemK/MazF family toxin [Flammeovirga yaeyamensis]|uniref:mRNA interferase n=1 Tax=Flammeovirga yaeyamensis TaxID=367791 RepID=A0AAX1NBS7_9BACT|nr:type II toxin-antitoxin system PemK/MazF family toxin [Flammeovirga yaeyamensis]MBB3699193.1 mRNA interferase MazF [Flammeovirga yaeyamensis]NMF35543.1 type II toxin-antitoxin system PemK/MazF family toxin [Flammeovirga yaeyamensis]QWG04401.1 type II toxin-antitoxin system PemK/MazF family toxin [Flammeovirga yaeyamensis]